MTKRNKILLGILIILLLLGALLVAYYWPAPKNDFVPEPQEQTELTPTEDTIIEKPIGDYIDASNQTEQAPTVSPEQVVEQQLQASVKAMTISFVERLGSYSNQSDYENIEELKPFMTNKMRTWADGFVVQQRAQEDANADYFGVDSKVLALDFKEFSEEDGRAEVEVNTQRIEYRGAQRARTIKYQKASITLLKQGDTWFVEEVIWL